MNHALRSVLYLCSMNTSNENKFTPVADLGEFGLIDHLTAAFPMELPENILGPGDDAAVIRMSDQRDVVVTSDMLVEGIHFDLMYAPLKHIGYKAIAVNLSDLAAMGARPTSVTVSVAMSNRYTVEAMEALYTGMRLACKRYGAEIVGGDTTTAPQGMTLSITAIGWVPEGRAILRSGARPNDIIVVTGDLGGAYMGLQLLEREKEVFRVNPDMQPDLQGHETVLERQLKPEPRLDVLDMLDRYEVTPTSMIDISDGLSSELLHLAKASACGLRIYEDKLPVSDGVLKLCDEFGLHPTVPVVNGGEDYELLFTIAPSDYEKVKGDPHFSFIGHMTDRVDEKFLVAKDGVEVPLEARGWSAFNSSTSGSAES